MWVKKGPLSNRAGPINRQAGLSRYCRVQIVSGLFLVLCLCALHDEVEHCVCNVIVLYALKQLFTVLVGHDLHDDDLRVLLNGQLRRDKRQIGNAFVLYRVNMLKLDLVAVLVDERYKIVAVVLTPGCGTSCASN